MGDLESINNKGNNSIFIDMEIEAYKTKERETVKIPVETVVCTYMIEYALYLGSNVCLLNSRTYPFV